MPYEMPFEEFQLICRYCHPGSDGKGGFEDTCRKPDRIPPGHSWEKCREDYDSDFLNYRRPEPGEKAKEKIVTANGDVISANIVDSRDADGYGYISHFATCSGAAKHRKR
jgi:hypothetical protein